MRTRAVVSVAASSVVMSLALAGCWRVVVVQSVDTRGTAGPPDGHTLLSQASIPSDAVPLDMLLRQYPCDSAVALLPPRLLVGLTGAPSQPFEMQDCQKLIVQGAYGPLVGVFPSDRMAALTDTLQFQNEVVSATVANWGVDYPALGIQGQGRSCLVLQRDGGAWRAEMVLPHRDSSCFSPNGLATGREGSGRTVLSIQELQHTGNLAYPPTARIGWDQPGNFHYIGVRCADRWCMVRPAGSPMITVQALTAGTPVDERRFIPGWFDEQRLAMPNAEGTMAPGPLATIFPVLDPITATTADFAKEMLVATVRMTGTNAELLYYKERFNLEATPANSTADQENHIYLNRDPAVADPNAGWWMVVQSPSGARRSFPVARVSQGHALPGAVRWRWDARDESSWISCNAGCCTPYGFE